MTNKKMIKTMVELQIKFNNETNGPIWTTGVTKEGKVIDWIVCILMETAESVDSFPWKHWKNINSGADINNLKVEFVDKWHFIISHVVSGLCQRTLTLDELQKDDLVGGVTDALDISNYNIRSGQELAKANYNTTGTSPEDTLFKLSKALLKTGDDIERILSIFYAVMKVFEEHYSFGMFELYELYIGKNALNKVRQMNGYKEGTYKKIWNGEEDNVVMSQAIEDSDRITFDGMVTNLNRYYIDKVK